MLKRLGPIKSMVTFEHESSHYTGSNSGGLAFDYSQIPQIGDDVGLDVAMRLDLGDLRLVIRPRDRIFLPNRSSYSNAPAVDLDLRWTALAPVQPFNAFFAERLFGTHGHSDAYLVRDLAGIVLPSKYGGIHLFVSAEIGNRQGLAVTQEQRELGLGARLAFE